MVAAPRILMADDEVGFLQTTVRLLQDEGYVVDSASDAETALKMLSTNVYNLVIADIMMPGNANLEFTERLGKERRGLPIIIVTGYPSVDTALKSMTLRVFAYFPKPFDFDEFAVKVKEAIKWNLVHETISNAERRLVEQIGMASQMREAMAASSEALPDTSLDSFLTLLHHNINVAMVDLGNLLKVQYGQQKYAETVCHILDCPQMNAYIGALERVVEVLRATKDSFKSKEIAALRRDIEALLANERQKANRLGLKT